LAQATLQRRNPGPGKGQIVPDAPARATRGTARAPRVGRTSRFPSKLHRGGTRYQVDAECRTSTDRIRRTSHQEQKAVEFGRSFPAIILVMSPGSWAASSVRFQPCRPSRVVPCGCSAASLQLFNPFGATLP